MKFGDSRSILNSAESAISMMTRAGAREKTEREFAEGHTMKREIDFGLQVS